MSKVIRNKKFFCLEKKTEFDIEYDKIIKSIIMVDLEIEKAIQFEF